MLVARRVPPAVAERAQREFDAVLAETDMDADAVITTASAHASQGIFSGPKVKLTAAHMRRCRRVCASSLIPAPAPTTWTSRQPGPAV